MHPSNKQEDHLERIFVHHPPIDEEIARKYKAIRVAGLEFARVVAWECPECADRTAAIRKIREAVMTANAAIALKPI